MRREPSYGGIDDYKTVLCRSASDKVGSLRFHRAHINHDLRRSPVGENTVRAEHGVFHLRRRGEHGL